MNRFEFGKNWSSFLKTLNPSRIEVAEDSLRDILEVTDLYGKSFLDIGCGSGLFSLAAKRLGASAVMSFDYDEQAVECSRVLKQQYFPGHHSWTVERGDALDIEYLEKLGQFDVVYSYGVLHHTGDMWRALENVSANVKVGGKLFLAIYNDQRFLSKTWLHIKRLYNRLPGWGKPLLVAIFIPGAEVPYVVTNLRQGKLPWAHWSEYYQRRGMSRIHDITDWVGGFPFEVAKPDKIFDLYRSKGFKLDRLITCGGGHDNNQFVFTRIS
ncbi:MAG: class I SAM-dependent methyltransferase [Deltaproteobacteria bacterium]|nr:class I SAM-dependent methyltransferase [Deltaproteobacteria bacterium]